MDTNVLVMVCYPEYERVRRVRGELTDTSLSRREILLPVCLRCKCMRKCAKG